MYRCVQAEILYRMIIHVKLKIIANTVKSVYPTCTGREILCQNSQDVRLHSVKDIEKLSKGHENQSYNTGK